MNRWASSLFVLSASALCLCCFACSTSSLPLPDKLAADRALRDGYLRVGDYSIRREKGPRLVFSREANLRRYGYGLIWLLPALPMFWSIYRRLRGNSNRNSQQGRRGLGWKLNLSIPVYIFFCALTTAAGTRVVLDMEQGMMRKETTRAGRTVRTLDERLMKDARGLRVLSLNGARETVLVLEFETAGENWWKLFPVSTSAYSPAAARELLFALESYTSETTGLLRFQR